MVSNDDQVMEEARYGFPDDFDVVFAGDAREAAPRVAEGLPALVIVDLRTGNAGGFVVARELEQLPGLHDVPVFMLLQRKDDEWLARQAGATLIRTKPIGASELVAEALTLLDV